MVIRDQPGLWQLRVMEDRWSVWLAALCLQLGLNPEDFVNQEKIKILQNKLNVSGQSIPGLPINRSENLAALAKIEVSSELVLDLIPFDGEWLELKTAAGQLLPLKKDIQYSFEISVDASTDTVLNAGVADYVQKFSIILLMC